MTERKDWDKSYKHGDTPWDTGFPPSELKKVLESGIVSPGGHALDLGCGTGTNAIYLAQKGFDVTAVDVSNVAIKKAKEKAKIAKAHVQFIQANAPELHITGEPFDFIFDRGCFHAIDDADRIKYTKMLERLTNDESTFLLLCGNAKEPREDGPPTVKEEEIRETFSWLFDFIWIQDFRFDSLKPSEHGPLGYSCLMKRKKIPT